MTQIKLFYISLAADRKEDEKEINDWLAAIDFMNIEVTDIKISDKYIIVIYENHEENGR